MTEMEICHGGKLFAPDSSELGYMFAQLDGSGWLTIGEIGAGNYLMLDKDEWPAFVRFVNEIDARVS